MEVKPSDPFVRCDTCEKLIPRNHVRDNAHTVWTEDDLNAYPNACGPVKLAQDGPMKTDTKEQVIGSWQCPNCESMAGTTWRGQPKNDDAPSCCGMQMFPYRILSQEERDIKIVSHWISDIEADIAW